MFKALETLLDHTREVFVKLKNFIHFSSKWLQREEILPQKKKIIAFSFDWYVVWLRHEKWLE